MLTDTFLWLGCIWPEESTVKYSESVNENGTEYMALFTCRICSARTETKQRNRYFLHTDGENKKNAHIPNGHLRVTVVPTRCDAPAGDRIFQIATGFNWTVSNRQRRTIGKGKCLRYKMAHTRPKWGTSPNGSSAALAGPIGVFIHTTMIGIWWSLIFLNSAYLFTV